MKTIIFCITGIALMATQAVYAQSEISRPKHEINIGVTDLFKPSEPQPPNNYYPIYAFNKADLSYVPYYEVPYSYHTRYGIGYKFHFGKNAARLSAAFGQESGDTKEDQVRYDVMNISSYSTLTMAYRLGYERTIIRQEKLDFYLAVDFILSQSESDNENEQFSPGQEYRYNDNTKYEETGGGLSLGIRYFVHKSISLSTETRIDYVRYTEDYKYESESIGTYNDYFESGNKDEGSKTSINPLAIFSVNVHF